MEGVQQECSTFIATVRRMDPKGTIFDGGWEEDSRRRRCESGHDVGKPTGRECLSFLGSGEVRRECRFCQ